MYLNYIGTILFVFNNARLFEKSFSEVNVLIFFVWLSSKMSLKIFDVYTNNNMKKKKLLSNYLITVLPIHRCVRVYIHLIIILFLLKLYCFIYLFYCTQLLLLNTYNGSVINLNIGFTI